MARVSTTLAVGGQQVATENRHLLGPVEGTWWKTYSWWVLPLGFLLLVWPGWLHRGIRWVTGSSAVTISAASSSTTPSHPPPAPIVVAPVVVQPPPVMVVKVEVPPPPVVAPTAPPPEEVTPAADDPMAGMTMTPEERRQYEIWVLRK